MESSKGSGAKESDSSGVRDQVQKAIDDLRGAGEKATGDVRSRIDTRCRGYATSPATRSGAQDQVSGWRETLDKATEDVRKGSSASSRSGRRARLESLDEIARGARRARRKELGKRSAFSPSAELALERAQEALAVACLALVVADLRATAAG